MRTAERVRHGLRGVDAECRVDRGGQIRDVDRILAPGVEQLVRWRPRLTLNLHGGTKSLVVYLASPSGTELVGTCQ